MARRPVRRISRGRRKFYKKYRSYRDMAYTAYKGVKLLKGLVNVENHLFDTSYNNTVNTTPSIIPLSDVVTGDDNGNRQGTSILMKHITLRGYIAGDTSAAITIFRIMVVMDLTNNGAVPSASQILQNPTAPGNMYSPLANNNTDRFWVLWDKLYVLDDSSIQARQIKKYIKLNKHAKFTSGSGTGKYEQNSLWAVVISNETTTLPSVHLTSRLSFYDN